MDLRIQIDKVSNGYICFDSFSMKSRVFYNLDEMLEQLKKLLSNPKKESEVIEQTN